MPRDVCKSQGALTTSAGSTALVGVNASRAELTICNNDASIAVFLGFSVAPGTTGTVVAPTAVLNSGLRLGPGQSYTTTNYRGAVAVIPASGTPVVTWLEL